MAYLSAEDTKKIRTALKTNFKQFKFSVTNSHYTGVNVTILSGPTDFGMGTYEQLNYFYPERYQDGEIFKKMRETVHAAVANYDNSDAQVDYFDVGYYEHWQIGRWNKPFVKTAK